MRSDEVAEDALQEVFVGVWRGARGWRGEHSGRVWLYALARRQAARTWRRRVGEPADPEPVDMLAHQAGFAADRDPEALVGAMEDVERLHRALGRLSDVDREVLTLRDLEGLTGPEVATLLELDLAAVKTRLHRARLRLLAELHGESRGGVDVG